MNWDEIDCSQEGLPESWEGEIMSLCDRIRKNSRDTNDWLKEVVNNNYLDLTRLFAFPNNITRLMLLSPQ